MCKTYIFKTYIFKTYIFIQTTDDRNKIRPIKMESDNMLMN